MVSSCPGFPRLLHFGRRLPANLRRRFSPKTLEKAAKSCLTTDTSYIYCGIYDAEGKLNSHKQLLRKLRSAAQRVTEQKRKKQWQEAISNVLDRSAVSATEDYLFPAANGSAPARTPNLSSGQLVLISTITELLASLEKQSIVLFDEPELHQHPNSIAGLLASLSMMLDKFESFAILATHSPLVIQQIPSAYVRMFIRVENTTVIREPVSEYFGENLTTITQEVFQTSSSPSLYQDWFKLALGAHDDDEILALFSKRLSFNALSVMESLKQR
jgi:predicted ATPase